MRCLLSPLFALLFIGCQAHVLPETSVPPLAIDGSSAVWVQNVSCGDLDETAFDLYHFDDREPTALVIFIHGGAFTSGEKELMYDGLFTQDMVDLVSAGVAVATVDYRLLDDVDTDGIIKPMGDVARCLQFMRYNAEELNIDPTRVGLAGTSAGAGTALWLATHDDLADANGDEPWYAESTRVNAVALYEVQATYDLVRWNDFFLGKFGLELFELAAGMEMSQTLWSVYGVDSDDRIEDDDIAAYRANVDMLALMDADDAPFWVKNVWEKKTFPLSLSALFHHPLHAKELDLRATELGVEHVTIVPELEIGLDETTTAAQFLISKL